MAAPVTPPRTTSKQPLLIQEAIYDYKKLQDKLKEDLSPKKRSMVLQIIQDLVKRYPALNK